MEFDGVEPMLTLNPLETVYFEAENNGCQVALKSARWTGPESARVPAAARGGIRVQAPILNTVNQEIQPLKTKFKACSCMPQPST